MIPIKFGHNLDYGLGGAVVEEFQDDPHGGHLPWMSEWN